MFDSTETGQPVIGALLYLAGAYLVAILLVNVRSFPLVWHAQVLLPIGIMRCKYYILSFWHLISFHPAATRHSEVVRRLESACPVGAHPFEFTIICKCWTGPDDADWLGHLSNSSYAKSRDLALSKFAVKALPTFLNTGGWVALSSTSYHFIHEIPIFANYKVRLTIGAWDQKWMYLVCRFTSQSKKNHNRKTKGKISSGASPEESASSTPTPRESESSGLSGEEVTEALATSLRADVNDGTILHCFSISRVCFKVGRVSVPPAVVLACEGFSKPSTSGSYSSPPLHWSHAQALRSLSDSLRNYRLFLTGAWRDVAEEERWWNEPLSGVVEEQRKANLKKFEVVLAGVNGCMSIG
ncbi:hypothetical protein HYDPIDRAFT_95850 [Hydnomerulius pinastri MD-312]|uniref:Uncharacterized protein n=1 Tax=Hydnomerulius pinastri MD-312 TaxID=994086 RepID=A0A0C9V7X7_9AGAM|nr:hypothetical protein HYDPIDRAFT_95850 [Hydnomerulius pinastri MD-312]